MTEFERQSYRLDANTGVAFAQRKSCWRSLRQSQGEGQSLEIVLELVRLHGCLNASGTTANEDLLSAQTCPLSETSLSRQQLLLKVLGTLCVPALVDHILLLHKWILQKTAVMCCH